MPATYLQHSLDYQSYESVEFSSPSLFTTYDLADAVQAVAMHVRPGAVAKLGLLPLYTGKNDHALNGLCNAGLYIMHLSVRSHFFHTARLTPPLFPANSKHITISMSLALRNHYGRRGCALQLAEVVTCHFELICWLHLSVSGVKMG
jgi:hypothetical protein